MHSPPAAISASDISRSYFSPGLKRRYQIPDPELVSPHFQTPGVDLDYHPSLSKYLARPATRGWNDAFKGELPSGWPKRLAGPLAWIPDNFEGNHDFVYELSVEERVEIDHALEYFKALNQSPEKTNQNTFPLPGLGIKLAKVRDQIYNGVGVAIMRGLTLDNYTEEEIVTIFLGTSSYIAERRGKQDHRGSMLSHVLSNHNGERNDDKEKASMPFHTDVVCDTLALLTRNCAAAGGMSTFASSWTVYNELAAKRPDLISVLADSNWPLDTFGRTPPYHNQALLFHTDNNVILSVSRRLLTGSSETPRSKGLPALTEKQAEALDSVHFIAEANSLKLSIEKGDICFINNTAILHSREAFEDSEFSQRHLLRLWLSNKDLMWKLPPPLELAWARVFDDQDRAAVWDFKPVKMNGRLFNPAASCD